MACRVRYRQDDIIAYGKRIYLINLKLLLRIVYLFSAEKDDERANLNEMPPEEKGLKAYSLNEVKLTPLKDID